MAVNYIVDCVFVCFPQASHLYQHCDTGTDLLEVADTKAGAWDPDVVTRLYTLINKCLAGKEQRCNINVVSSFFLYRGYWPNSCLQFSTDCIPQTRCGRKVALLFEA